MNRLYLGKRPFFGRTPAHVREAMQAALALGALIVRSRVRYGYAVYAIL